MLLDDDRQLVERALLGLQNALHDGVAFLRIRRQPISLCAQELLRRCYLCGSCDDALTHARRRRCHVLRKPGKLVGDLAGNRQKLRAHIADCALELILRVHGNPPSTLNRAGTRAEPRRDRLQHQGPSATALQGRHLDAVNDRRHRLNHARRPRQFTVVPPPRHRKLPRPEWFSRAAGHFRLDLLPAGDGPETTRGWRLLTRITRPAECAARHARSSRTRAARTPCAHPGPTAVAALGSWRWER